MSVQSQSRHDENSRADIDLSRGVIKWAGGIVATVLSAVLINFLLPRQPKPPENPGLTHYADPAGVISIDYPAFLGKLGGIVPGQWYSFGEGLTGSGALIISISPDKNSTAREGSASKDHTPSPFEKFESSHGWLRYRDQVTINHGSPPEDWTFIEMKEGIRLLNPRYSNILKVERKGGFLVVTAGFFKYKNRQTYRTEIDSAFASLKFDPTAAWRAFISRNPNDATAFRKLGLELFRQGDRSGAIAAYRKALELNANDPVTHHNLAFELRATGDVEDAIREYRNAIQLRPDVSVLHSDFADALCDVKDWTGAIAEYETAVRLDLNDYYPHYRLADALIETGGMDRALIEYHTAIQLNYKNANAHYHLGQALEKKGDLTAALAEYRRASLLKPSNQDTKAGLAARINRITTLLSQKE